MVALAFWAHPSAVMCSVWHFHVCSCFRKTFGIRNQVTDCTSLIKGLGWFDLMALPNVHINPTVLTPADSVWVFYGYLLPKAQFNMKKSKLLCVYLYHQWNGSTIPLPTLLSMLLNWHSLGVEGCITHKLEVRKHSIVPWLAEEKLWRSHGGKGKPSSCIATFLCSFATETGRCQKARVWVTYNLWICDDSPSQLCWVKALQQAIQTPDTGCVEWLTPHSGMGTGGQRAKAVAQCYSRWQPGAPHVEPGLIILGTSDLHPSELISSLH